MAEAIRRLLGLVPVLLVGSIVLFFLLGRHPRVQETRRLPLFFQAHPVSAESAALRAMRGAARGDASRALELAELGGAALPHVLPRLSELGVAERRRVALALEPVAQRMQLDDYRRATTVDASSDVGTAADERILAWERYYEDHDLDFRPLSVERLVRRLPRRSSVEESDLVAVDTYALPYLVDALGRVDTQQDVDRVARLSAAIARLDGSAPSLRERATRDDARALASTIRKDFDRSGARFTELGRVERLASHLAQTEFGVFWTQTLRELRGVDTPVVYRLLAGGLQSSAQLLTLALLGALVLGPLLAGALHLALLHSIEGSRLSKVRRLLALSVATIVPPFCLLGTTWGPLASAIMLLTATLASAATVFGELCADLDWRPRAVLVRRTRGNQVRSVAAALSMTLPTLLPLVAGEILLWLACVELASERDGLFPRTMAAFERGDLHVPLTLSLLSWLCIALLQLLSDAILPRAAAGRRSW